MKATEITVFETTTLKEALESLDRIALGIVFVVDRNRKLLGALSDGDVRRALLNGAVLTDSVVTVMNRKFFSLPVGTDNERIVRSFSEQIKIIPLLDSEGRVVDFATNKKVRQIPVAAPQLDGNELAYVTDCIRTSWISSQGKYVREFESIFKEKMKVAGALAVSNGTVALHLALVALGVGEGDEVIVPNFTFAASVNAILYAGAVPVLADIDPKTWNLSVETIIPLLTEKTKAIMPVHLYGHPCDMAPILKLAEEKNLLVVEDCAEALGSKYKGVEVGSFGDAATFSFFGNKTITTGEGGMVLFRNSESAERAAVLRDHGMSKEKRYWHVEVGFNYRMTNLQAALGVAQMERLDHFVFRKRSIAEYYNSILKNISGITLPPEESWAWNSYWLYTFLLPEGNETRMQLTERMNLDGIETRPVFYPIHSMPPYQGYIRSDLSVSESISRRGFSLPSSVNLTEEDMYRVGESLKRHLPSIIG
ncbi:aminotransferase class I/II-fold pyridoxal phosphate-dependent enzyme [Leptospira gomenensis]|uniref:GDP-perosamine synthase n=1 Tax=Leptospira gomenensis TaxID=2484974 RepID=A0A5F1Z1N1_9LEPT|nr:aminotransferase class I/II-fold pyridoxal phosphate-dependent enzyme [Leptospira gomenensis]TGK30929.1 aminotransferase class I/II-fold pyridoxal phosphate-dependent enzyme [Leptospira gomenensis]TGK38172.1 aminotransferase class I/II-fold pyridoxal phosphate-dependent enzyme [Leptospira gomenensis]TGK45351.1 aminotransferase class I/II-fold pyridoxal phosphate-dependent enzyme [Leptospira gomenensis]TGK66264.1 aminotransferase class I/II-fold pyridoxal phosphate-dependent enzyme [Leptospir